MIKESSNRGHILILIFVVFLSSVGLLTHNVFADGQAASTCTNLYNGTIISFTINNGSQTFDPMAHPGVNFNVYENSGYTASFIIHAANKSNNNNTNAGDVWDDTNTPGFEVGVCDSGASPNQNVTVNGAGDSYPSTFPPGQPTTQSVWFTTYGSNNRVTFNVHWMPTPSPTPSSPIGLTATAASSSQINLNWSAPSNTGGSSVTGYQIQRSTNGTTWSTIQSNTGTTSTTYNDTGLAPSTTYTYQVSAINSVGTSTPSNTASATTSSGTTTGSIVLNNVQSTSGTVSSSPYRTTLANFNAGTGTNRLLVVGVEANNNNVASITFGGVPLTKKVSTFSNNDAEFWYLKNPSGTGNIVVTMAGSTSVVVGAYSFSGVDQTTPIPTSTANHNTSPSSPTVSITTQNPNSWVLDSAAIYGGTTLGSPTCTQQWDTKIASAITGASSSMLQASAGPITCSWTASSGDFWDDAAVEVKASGTGTGTATAPGSPTGLTATVSSSSQINLSWIAPSSNGGSTITGYKIERSTDGGTTWSTIQSNTSSVSTTYSDTGLAPSTAYTYRVSAINSVGTSLPSSTVTATTLSSTPTPTVPSAPTGLTATAGNSQISLSWTVSSSNGGATIAGYNIYRGTTSGGESTTPVANVASTSYTDTSVTNGQVYYYTVKAFNSVGTSSASNEASATPTAPTTTGITLNNVQSTSGTTSSNQMTISSFNAGTNANSLLVVGVSANNAGVTSVTFGGAQLTQAVSSFNNNDAEFWYLKNPTGTGNIMVTMAGSTQAVVGAYAFSGVDQTNPIPTTATKSNTVSSSPLISITTKYANDMVLDLPSIYGGKTLGSPTCTQEWNVNVPSTITGASSSTTLSSSGSATCGWTASNGGDLWDDVAVELKAG